MKDFLDWVGKPETPEIFLVLFVIGCFVGGFSLIAVAFILHPMLGAAAFIALFFGIPYVSYRMRGK
jgi:hypothetical protein